MLKAGPSPAVSLCQMQQPRYDSDSNSTKVAAKMYLVISTSLNPNSRSRLLARCAMASLEQQSSSAQFIDLAETKLPACDGGQCYGDPNAVVVRESVEAASGILLAGPIYNYDLGASAKNMIELTGKAWTGKVVGFLCAAGGQGSFMAPMGIANSLMLDFRSFIVPRFVYATGEAFSGDQIADEECEERVKELASELIRISTALTK